MKASAWRRATRRRSCLVQSAVGAEHRPALLNVLDGVDTGKVVTREPTLEDAYVELVRSA